MRINSDRLWEIRDEVAALKKERKRLLKELFIADSDDDLIAIEAAIDELSDEHDRVWAAIEAYRKPKES